MRPATILALAVLLGGVGVDSWAAGDEPYAENMNLVCTRFTHKLASGDEKGYYNYWEDLALDGWGNYQTTALGKYGGQKGRYQVRDGQVSFDGFLGDATTTLQFHGKRQNAHGQLENEYQIRIVDKEGTTHSTYCTVMGRVAGGDKLPELPRGGGGLEGLYFYYAPDVFIGGVRQAQSRYYYFMKSGLLYNGFPAGGMKHLDCRDSRYRKDCKTYRIGGGNIEVAGDGPRSFERRGRDLVIGGKTFWPVKTVGAGELPGRYTFSWAIDGAVHQELWTFNRDRTFKRGGSGGDRTGTYAVDGYSLLLHYDNGEKTEHTLTHTYGGKNEITIDGNECHRN